MLQRHSGPITRRDRDIAQGYRDGTAAGIRGRLDGIEAIAREMLAEQRRNHLEWRRKMSELDDAVANLTTQNGVLIQKCDALIEVSKANAAALRDLANSGDVNHETAVKLNALADAAAAEATKASDEAAADQGAGTVTQPPATGGDTGDAAKS